MQHRYQDIPTCDTKSCNHCVCLSHARLDQDFYIPFRILRYHPVDLFQSAIPAVSFNIDDLYVIAEQGDPQESVFNIASFIPAGNDYGR
jgi:hypothetical protein